MFLLLARHIYERIDLFGHCSMYQCHLTNDLPGVFCLRVCLLAITIVCSRLQRSPDLQYLVENALRAFSTRYCKFFARRSRASTRPEKAKTPMSPSSAPAHHHLYPMFGPQRNRWPWGHGMLWHELYPIARLLTCT